MPIKNFIGGDTSSVDAVELNRYLIQSHHVVKPSDESVVSSTTMQDDDHLQIQVQPNTNYWVMCQILYTGTDAADLKIGWSGPSGATFKWLSDALGSGVTSTTDVVSRTMQGIANEPAFGCIAGSDGVGVPKGILQVGSSGGTFKLRWAQSASSATASTIYARSLIMVRRLTT